MPAQVVWPLPSRLAGESDVYDEDGRSMLLPPDSDWGNFRGRAIYTTKGPPTVSGGHCVEAGDHRTGEKYYTACSYLVLLPSPPYNVCYSRPSPMHARPWTNLSVHLVLNSFL